MSHRLSITVSDDMYDVVMRVAKQENETINGAVKKLVKIGGFVHEKSREGKSLFCETDKGTFGQIYVI